jgi:hypothetical protein
MVHWIEGLYGNHSASGLMEPEHQVELGLLVRSRPAVLEPKSDLILGPSCMKSHRLLQCRCHRLFS